MICGIAQYPAVSCAILRLHCTFLISLSQKNIRHKVLVEWMNTVLPFFTFQLYNYHSDFEIYANKFVIWPTKYHIANQGFYGWKPLISYNFNLVPPSWRIIACNCYGMHVLIVKIWNINSSLAPIHTLFQARSLRSRASYLTLYCYWGDGVYSSSPSPPPPPPPPQKREG